MPAVAAQCAQFAAQALRERRIRDAHLPRIKTLDEFEFLAMPQGSRHRRFRSWLRADTSSGPSPSSVYRDSGTGKTHLLTALAGAAYRLKRRVRFATAAALC
jgi:DNA replication protein DnaC